MPKPFFYHYPNQITKKTKAEYSNFKHQINNNALLNLQKREIINSIGQKLIQIYCPQCQKEYPFTEEKNFLKHQKRFHSEKFNQGKDLEILKKTVQKKEPYDRVFYVDVALSNIKHKETGKRFWKCSVVENGKNVANWVNSVCNKTTVSKKDGKTYQVGTNTAEAYTILKVVYWLMEQKWKGSIKIYTDNTVVSEYCKRSKNKPKIAKQGLAKYLSLACKNALENSIDLNVDWVPGKDNPADYYSRH